MENDEECITGLSLGLGTGGNVHRREKQKVKKPVPYSLDIPLQLYHEEEEEEDKQSHSPNAKSDDNSHTTKNRSAIIRKKLRLTKDQLAMLESSFKLHSTLNSGQKQALADQLNLKARQIEVWFQNRRARTKLKQTEVDCELLKRRCQSLSDENRKLKKELQELRALKLGTNSPLYIQLSKATTLTMCSSCDKLVKPDERTNE